MTTNIVSFITPRPPQPFEKLPNQCDHRHCRDTRLTGQAIVWAYFDNGNKLARPNQLLPGAVYICMPAGRWPLVGDYH